MAQSPPIGEEARCAIQYSRGKRRKAKLYRDLITATRATMASLRLRTASLASGSIGSRGSGAVKSNSICR